MDVEIDWPDPAVELRAPGLRVQVPRLRAAFLDRLERLPGAEPYRQKLRNFFAHQHRVANALWPLLDQPELFPSLGWTSLARHAVRLPVYLPVLRDVGRPLIRVLERYGVADFAPLRTYLEAICRITVQCGVLEAEAPLALAAMDYWFRGTGHVRGGIGRLARAMADTVCDLGGRVHYTDRVKSLRPLPSGEGWEIQTRRRTLRARCVIANVLPQALQTMLGGAGVSDLNRIGTRVEEGWGACMIYRVAKVPVDVAADVSAADGLSAQHLSLVGDLALPFEEGNHVFLSVTGAHDGHTAPAYRALTASTHIHNGRLQALSDDEQATHVAAVQARMVETLAQQAPEWCTDICHHMTASPRTFERFTGRPGGWVGGVPRRAGLGAYSDFLRPPRLPSGLHLVGDSTFPGQSTLATALGGRRAALDVLSELGRS
jgi:phytoene dehydrogenase-like protein